MNLIVYNIYTFIDSITK